MGYYYPDGLSDKAGAHRLLTKPIYTSSPVLYMHAQDGSAVTGTGMYNRPIAAAGTLAVGQILVVKDGSAEVLLAAVTPAIGQTIIGEVSAGGVPTASITAGYAGGVIPAVTVDGHQWVNLRVPSSTVATGTSRFALGDGCRMVDCKFEDNSTSTAYVIEAGSENALEGCTVSAAGTTMATAPDSESILASNDNMRMLDCVFDDGFWGRYVSNGVSVLADSCSGLRVYGASLLRGTAYMAGGTESSAPLGIVNISLATQGAQFIDTYEVYTLHPAGLSDGLGDRLLEDDPVYASGVVYYVDSATGDDTNSGSPEEPFASLAGGWAAITPAGHEVFILRLGHQEELSAQLEIDQDGVTIIGEGDPSDSTGCVTIVTSTAIGVLLSGGGGEVRNIRFEHATSAPSTATILAPTGAGVGIVGCYFTTTFLVGGFIGSSGDYGRIEDCTFVSAGTDVDDRPTIAVGFTSPAGTLVKDCTFDGGTVGFDSWALDGAGSGTPTSFRGENIILLNGADAKIHASSTGYFQVTASDTSKVEAF